MADVYEGRVGTDQVGGKVDRAPWATEKQRPIGVSILAVWNMIGAGLMGVGAYMVGTDPYQDGGATVALVLTLMAIGQFIVSLGLWRLKNWARLIAVGLYGISAGLGLIELFVGNPLGILQTVVAGSIARYLTREHVVYAFTS